jgi:hypothetical protein
MSQLFVHISDAQWIAGYQTGSGIARRLDGMRSRLGLGRFAPPAKERLADAIDALAAPADDAVRAILARQ